MLSMNIVERRTWEGKGAGVAALCLGIAFIASSASSASFAENDDGLGKSSEQRMFYPSDVQQKRIELRRSEQWKMMSEKQRKKALKAIDDEFAAPSGRSRDDLRDAYLPRARSADPAPLPMELMKPMQVNGSEVLASAASTYSRPPAADLDSPVWTETLPARRVLRFPSEVL